jgi:hypothetical protein
MLYINDEVMYFYITSSWFCENFWFYMFTILSLKKLLLRPTETIVCVLAFGLGMASLAICWTLLDYSFWQTKILESSLLARSYVVKSAKSDIYALFASGYVKAGSNVKKEKQFFYSDLQVFQKQLQGLASVFFSEERVTAPNGDDSAASASIYEVTPDYFDGVQVQLTLGRKINKHATCSCFISSGYFC